MKDAGAARASVSSRCAWAAVWAVRGSLKSIERAPSHCAALTFDDLFALVPAGIGAWTAAGAPQTDEARLFGGMLIGLAIVAASRETPRCHALHAFFIGPGSKQEAFAFAVERTRDGRSFATRRVEIRQRERLLLAVYSSHHAGDPGPEHQFVMPDVPAPEDVEDRRLTRARRAQERGTTARRYLAETMLDVRPFDLPDVASSGAIGRRAIWMHPRERLRGGRDIHQAAIAFASDVGLIGTGLRAHNHCGDGGEIEAASLDHSIWFHRDASADDWLLHVQCAPVAAHGKGLSQSAIFTRDGQLVASAAQQFLARRKRLRHT